MSSSQASNVWFITGASTGLGRAFAAYAIQKNYKVIVTARNIATVSGLAEQHPENVLAAKLDVNSATDIQTSLDSAMEKFGRIDVLINNAGYALIGPCEETTEEQLRDQFNTNFFGAVAVTRAVIPIMRQQKSGAIVQISSVVGSLSYPGFGAYSASKFTLEGYSEALRAEMESFGVKVLIVKPGAFRTAISSGKCPVTSSIGVYDDMPAGQLKVKVASSHGKQPGDPDKAAEAVDVALQAEHTPLRLLLGTDCVDALTDRAVNQLQEYEAWDAVARSTDFSI